MRIYTPQRHVGWYIIRQNYSWTRWVCTSIFSKQSASKVLFFSTSSQSGKTRAYFSHPYSITQYSIISYRMHHFLQSASIRCFSISCSPPPRSKKGDSAFRNPPLDAQCAKWLNSRLCGTHCSHCIYSHYPILRMLQALAERPAADRVCVCIFPWSCSR